MTFLSRNRTTTQNSSSLLIIKTFSNDNGQKGVSGWIIFHYVAGECFTELYRGFSIVVNPGYKDTET